VLRGKLIELDVEIRDLFSKTGTIYTDKNPRESTKVS
jgi:hypothetical protein